MPHVKARVVQELSHPMSSFTKGDNEPQKARAQGSGKQGEMHGFPALPPSCCGPYVD